jgi:tetratricopeptide (TPR) repeat protein
MGAEQRIGLGMITHEVESPLQVLIAKARRAVADGEWTQADGLWRRVRDRFPEISEGYMAGAECLGKQGLFAEAAALLRLGVERFPDDEWMAVERAWSLFQAGDFSDAMQLCLDIRRRFPDNLGGYLAGAITSQELGEFEEAEAIYREGLSRFPHSPELWVNFASCAEERHAPEAVERWHGVVARFRDSEQVLCAYAWAAHNRQDWPDALRRWEAVLKEFPHSREPRCRAAEALGEMGRFGEAIQVLDPALRMLPDDVEIAVLHGWLATWGRDFSEAERVWREVRTRFPDNRDGYRGYAWVLREVDRWDESGVLLEEAMRRFPDDVEIAIDRADAEACAAAHRQDQPRVIDIWHSIRARFPDHPRVYVGLGQALRDSGELDRSAQTLKAAVSRFPGDQDVEVQLALTLGAQRRWPEALRLLASLLRRYPGHSNVRSGIGQVLEQAMIDRAAGVGEPFDIPESLLAAEANSESVQEVGTLLNRFESLGNSCEFPMVQRLYGVNNLSLLRWAAIPPDKLILALNEEFDGVGDPQNTLVAIADEEYTTEDARYYMRSHTFTRASSEPLETFAADQCRRIRWLRGKLLKSLRSAAKIFVYMDERAPQDIDLLELHEALCRYSRDIVLLFVTLENARHPSGSVVEVRPRAFAGYIDRLSPVDISVDAWVSLCRQVVSNLAHDRHREVVGR